MKAVVCQDAELEVAELPEPEPAKGQLLIDVVRCGICGSDLHLYHGLVPDTRVGHIFGHEFTGIVEEVGTLVVREEQTDAARMEIRADKVLQDVALGDSISVNGVCLTAVGLCAGERFGGDLRFDPRKLVTLVEELLAIAVEVEHAATEQQQRLQIDDQDARGERQTPPGHEGERGRAAVSSHPRQPSAKL